MDGLRTYVNSVREARFAGVRETSHYPALKTLIDDCGRELKPKVHCVVHPSGSGAGLPDCGLFTPDQLKNDRSLPNRGVVEVKGASESLQKTSDSLQVDKYLKTYGQVLVTNLWEFRLLHRDGSLSESYSLAESEAAFWSEPLDVLVKKHNDRFRTFLKRVLLSNVRLDRPQDVAEFLASYARDARAKLEDRADLSGLAAVRKALEEALGLTFQGDKAEKFFRSTLVQTLFYGIFSAWVLWHEEKPNRSDMFDWRTSAWNLHVPMIQSLFQQVSMPAQLKESGLFESLELAGALLNRVERLSFFTSFETGAAMQYFYEPFLEAFDPELRKDLGVWYTPPEIVRYMVERVDQVLRSELGITDGLADERVVVLDPCCGTGAYLVEVLRKIEESLRESGNEAALAQELKRAASTRIFGFELLPAPFVIAHLQIGLRLMQLGAPLIGGDRVGVLLTNALTGWDPLEDSKRILDPFGFGDEREAALRVKREQKILVVIGNPPYDGYAGIALDESRVLTEAYRRTRREDIPPPQGQGLNDLYVRFFRMAERQVTETDPNTARTGYGIVCFISNYSWLEGLSFTAMREQYLERFDRIWIDNLNGDKYATGKTTPTGQPDPSVFSTRFNREGIQVGTAIAMMVRHYTKPPSADSNLTSSPSKLLYRDLWGKSKREDLLEKVYFAEDNSAGFDSLYTTINPAPALGLPFKPRTVTEDFSSWPILTDIFPKTFSCVQTKRDDALVDMSSSLLRKRMEAYFDATLTNAEVSKVVPRLMKASNRFEPEKTREALLARGMLHDNIVRYLFRPLDLRYVYWEPRTKLLGEKSPQYHAQCIPGNKWMVTTGKLRRSTFDPPVFTEMLCDLNLLDGGALAIPMALVVSQTQGDLFDGPRNTKWAPNVTPSAQIYLANLDVAAASSEDVRTGPDDISILFFHAFAIMHSNAYGTENEGALRQDWPRIPLPYWTLWSKSAATSEHAPLCASTRHLLLESSNLGRNLASLLDVASDVPGVTSGKLAIGLRSVAAIKANDGSQLFEEKGDYIVDARWGYRGLGGVTMPGSGSIAINNGIVTIHLNPNVSIDGVPETVWRYSLGGYQVLKKWLSYRDEAVLGRPLRYSEILEFQRIIRRIAAIVQLREALDANYRQFCTS